jgi:hypothetical protein
MMEGAFRVDERSFGSKMVEAYRLRCRQVTIGTLPDNTLLETFGLYMEEAHQGGADPEWPDI